MRNPKIPESEHEKIVDLYKDGSHQQEIADMYNVTRSVIQRILRINNVDNQRTKFKKSEYQTIVDMYQNGLTQYEIAEHYGVEQGSVAYVLKKMGVECKNRRYKLNIKEDATKIIDMRSGGYSISEIAEKYNVTSSRIGEILRDNGINTPNERYLQYSYDEVLDMHNTYLAGMSVVDIANKHNICVDSVYNLFLRYDLKVKSISQAKQQYEINKHYFDIIDTPNKAYILGLLYADGCNMTDKHEVTISLQERDKHILEQIKNELGYDGPLRFIDYNNKNPNHQNQYKLDITNKHLSESLNVLGVWKNKSLILEWPEWLDEKLYAHFVRGYFDGDGSLYFDKRNGATVAFVGTEMFLTRFSSVLQKQLEIDMHICDCNEKYKPVTKLARLHSRSAIKKFLDWIYNDADMKLIRKYNKYQQFLNNINNSCCV